MNLLNSDAVKFGAYALLAFYFTCLLLLSFFSAHRYMMLYFFYRHRAPKLGPPLSDDALPVVTVQLPVFNERMVVERLLRSMAHIDYPRQKLQVQVLDDSTDDSAALAQQITRELAAGGLDIVYIHRNDRTGYKAGALQNGMLSAKGDFIAIFDADFIPEPQFLRQTMPFFQQPHVGMVQMRWEHLNRGYSLLTQAQSIMLDGHFVIEHAARNFSGRFCNFNGTAGIWRKTAIESAGGWQHDTLTEDLDLSYRAQLKGWKFVYLPQVTAPAELPVEINAFKTQQHRWTKGSIQTALKLLPAIWRSHYDTGIKVEATFHLANNFAYLLLLGVAILTFPVMLVRQYFHIEIPAIIDFILFCGATLSIGSFYIAGQRAILPNWKEKLAYIPFMMSLGIGLCVINAKAVLEVLVGHQSGFVRTPKFGVERSGEAWFKNPYLTKNSSIAFIEAAFAIYYLGVCIYCLFTGNLIVLPFMLLFLVGFGYVGGLSVLSLFRRPPAAAPTVLAPIARAGAPSHGVRVQYGPSADRQ